MKNTRLLFTLFGLLLAFGASAQFSVGLRSGVSWGSVRQTEALDQVTPEFGYLDAAFQGAVVGEYAFSEGFALQAELALARKGFSYRQDANVEVFQVPVPLGVLAEARFQYLELPVLAKVRFGGEQVKGYLLAGPHIAYATGGQLATRADGLFDFNISKTNIDLDAINYERLEFGGTVGAGASFNAGFGTFFVDARYQHGFTELYNIPLVDEHIRNSGFGINVGFMLPIGVAQ